MAVPRKAGEVQAELGQPPELRAVFKALCYLRQLLEASASLKHCGSTLPERPNFRRRLAERSMKPVHAVLRNTWTKPALGMRFFHLKCET